MAVDPLTAKILAKVAMQAATDSESRKRILFMILAPVLGLLLLIAFILYLISLLCAYGSIHVPTIFVQQKIYLQNYESCSFQNLYGN